MAEISKITLPSGTTYDLKDATAREMISGGISFIIAWDGNSAPVVSDIPEGVTVTYNGQTYTGTMDADDAQAGAFYLVAYDDRPNDIYSEYVPVGTTGSKYWEKIGDTSVDLSDVVTDVTLNKQTTEFVTGYSSPTTDTVIGSNATFSFTQPTVTVTPSTTYLGASASGTAVGADGTAAAITGFGTHTTQNFVTSVSAESNKKLVTTSITGVSGSTTASKATAATSQTTADGTGTASTTNTDWLKGVSVSNETLVIGAATMDTQTTTQFTFADVTVPTAASSATTVATGSATTSGTGAAVVTSITIGNTGAAITALGTPTTANALTGVKVTAQPSVSLSTNASTGTGRVQVATGISSASATDGAVAWNSKDQVTALTGLGTASKASGLNNTTSITVTKGNE